MNHLKRVDCNREIIKPVTEAVYEEVDGGLLEVDQKITFSILEKDNSLENLLY